MTVKTHLNAIINIFLNLYLQQRARLRIVHNKILIRCIFYMFFFYMLNYINNDDEADPLMVIFASAHFVWIRRLMSDVVPSSRDTEAVGTVLL